MSKQDFKRECEKYGHVYGINDYGQPTKDGVVTEGMRISEDGDGNIIVCDYSAVIGTLKDFGYNGNPQRVRDEFIGDDEKKFEDGEIDKISRFIHRDKDKGMFCLDHHAIFKADGVTTSEKREWYSVPAPYEYLNKKVKE